MGIIIDADQDIDSFEKAFQHYRAVGVEEVQSFKSRIYGLFRGRHVKELIDTNIRSTIKRFEYGIALYPDYLPFYNELGIAYRENNELENAIEVLNKAIEIDPNNLPSYNELGIAYRENNELENAIEVLNKAIEIDPNHLPSYNELGIAYRENNELENAIEVLNKAIEIDPNHLPSYNELGIAYRENNELENAIEVLNKAIEIDPNNLAPYIALIDTYIFFCQDKENAQKYIRLGRGHGLTNRMFNNCDYKKFIDDLDVFASALCTNIRLGERYVFHAIRVRAYRNALKILFALKKQHSYNPRVTNKLGKTLANPAINRREEAMCYIVESIEMYKQCEDEKQVVHLIMYYLRGLLYTEQIDLLERELKKYSCDIIDSPDYHRFLARYFVYLGKSDNQIVDHFQLALKKSRSQEEYKASIKAYIYFLKNESKEDCSDLIYLLKNRIHQD